MDPQRWITAGSGDPVIARNRHIRKDVPKELRDMLLTGDEYQRLGAVQQLREIIARDGGSYTARRAVELLREGLKSPRWVSVQEAIRSVPGVEETTPPPVADEPPEFPAGPSAPLHATRRVTMPAVCTTTGNLEAIFIGL